MEGVGTAAVGITLGTCLPFPWFLVRMYTTLAIPDMVVTADTVVDMAVDTEAMAEDTVDEWDMGMAAVTEEEWVVECARVVMMTVLCTGMIMTIMVDMAEEATAMEA